MKGQRARQATWKDEKNTSGKKWNGYMKTEKLRRVWG
jgi:hypothetical protein